MATKKQILFIFLALSMLTTARGQLVFSSTEWNFGTIREDDGRVSHVFTGVNRGDKPLVILDVVASCGCTRPEFSRQPIVPGGKAQITVTYDPANRPGTFAKELGVYSSERKKVATLTVRGSVTPRPKSTEELYPIDAGGGLRLNSTLCAFSYVYPGRRTQSVIGYANTSDCKIVLELRRQQNSGLLEITAPREIAPGATGEINLAYFIPSDKPRYGTLRDAVEVYTDGSSNATTILAHAIGVDAPSNAEKPSAPKAEISENMLKFGPVKRTGSVQRQKFTLSNTGGSELIVRTVENDGHVATTLAPGRRIPAGGAITVEVMLDPRGQAYGVMTDQLILITNDPDRPMRRLRVTAIIEE